MSIRTRILSGNYLKRAVVGAEEITQDVYAGLDDMPTVEDRQND
jgi:hypothetical protein